MDDVVVLQQPNKKCTKLFQEEADKDSGNVSNSTTEEAIDMGGARLDEDTPEVTLVNDPSQER